MILDVSVFEMVEDAKEERSLNGIRLVGGSESAGDR